MNENTPAEYALAVWVAQVLAMTDTPSLDLVAGDASPRRYFRVRVPKLAPVFSFSGPSSSPIGERTLIALLSPASEKNQEFLQIRSLLETHNVRVPGLVAADIDRGFMLLEDLGNDMLLPLLSEFSASVWYAKGLNTLVQLAQIPTAASQLPPYDADRLQLELDLFTQWFLAQLLGLAPTYESTALFRALSQVLVSSAAEQPQVVVHRDFHSRNLMVVNNAELAVIDFQDAVVGPITYDPVSLLKDCYIRWPRDRQLAWLADYQNLLEQREIMNPVPEDEFVRWFDLMGLQRHIKVLGIFARLYLRDGKPGYLNDLPLVLAYVRETLALYSPTEPAVNQFQDWFERNVMPICREQPWYSMGAEVEA